MSKLDSQHIPRRRRFARIAWYFVRLVAHIIVWDLLLGRRFWFRWYADQTRVARYQNLASRFRGLALDLGGVMIKLGQFASTRVDILPPSVIAELIGLQDEVNPVAFPAIKYIIENELGGTIETHFATFDPTPVAAASFGQVYRASLHTGEQVALKVQRPAIEDYVKIDIAALRWVASWMQYYRPIRRRTNLVALTEEFARITLRELNYTLEADHADRFRRNFAGDPTIHIPQMYREYSAKHVLCMEWVNGYKITDYTALDRVQIDRLALAEKLYLTYLQQCFEDGFFHADPHPGNLFVLPVGEVQPNGYRAFQLSFLDFGMVDEISPRIMEGLATAATGIVLRDAQKIIDGSHQVGTLMSDVDENRLRQAIEIWFSYTYGRTLRELQEIDIEGFVGGVSDVLYDLPFQLPQSLLFLGRAVGVVGGVATGLAPEFDVFSTTRPFALRFIREQHSAKDIRDRLASEGRELLFDLTQLPHHALSFYKRAARGDLQIRPELPNVERRLQRIESAIIRMAAAVAAGALFISSAVLQAAAISTPWTWWIGGILLTWALWPRPSWLR